MFLQWVFVIAKALVPTILVIIGCFLIFRSWVRTDAQLDHVLSAPPAAPIVRGQFHPAPTPPPGYRPRVPTPPPPPTDHVITLEIHIHDGHATIKGDTT